MPDELENPIELLPEEEKTAFREILKRCKAEDSHVRYALVRTWKKAEEFWHGIQYIYWSETAHEWRTPDNKAFEAEETRDSAGPAYDYVINIYKAHGESVIAALSQQVPVVEFFPDDADVADDISTAKTKTKIAILIQKHNRSKLLLMEALHKLFNAGVVASYVHPKADNEFGTRQIPVYGKENFDINYEDCPTCGARLGEQTDEIGAVRQCPVCNSEIVPNVSTEQEGRTVQTGTEDVPKSRTIIEIFGPLNFKIPYHIRKQKEAGYILQFVEQNFAIVRNTYPFLRDKIKADYALDTDRWTRSPSTLANVAGSDDTLSNLVTVEKLWIRPWLFDSLETEEITTEQGSVQVRDYLKEKYPKGCKVVFVGQEIAEIVEEDLDEVWEIGKAGPSTYIHADSMGNSLIPVQEMRNTLSNLGIETVEHGIPTGFADPDVLNFDEYSKTEALPGSIYPAKPKPGARIGDAFYEQKTATLSKEVQPFLDRLDQDGQFVTGSFPSIYGGPTEASSRTAAEYNMSRQQALQRLSISWEFLRIWWTNTIRKAVNCFIKNLVDDERYVTKEGNIYTNVLIRRADLLGKANVEPEASEHFPISSAQKNEVLIKLMQLNNPGIQAVIEDVENSKNISAALGFPELHIPGENQRYKQLAEIAELVKIDNMVTPEMMPTVQTEPDVDEEEIHVEICKIYLSSERGQDLKKMNPAAYMNVYAHLQLHTQSLQAKAQEQMLAQMHMQGQLNKTETVK